MVRKKKQGKLQPWADQTKKLLRATPMYTIGQEDNQETKHNPNSAYWNRQRLLLLINTSQDNLPIKVSSV